MKLRWFPACGCTVISGFFLNFCIAPQDFPAPKGSELPVPMQNQELVITEDNGLNPFLLGDEAPLELEEEPKDLCRDDVEDLNAARNELYRKWLPQTDREHVDFQQFLATCSGNQHSQRVNRRDVIGVILPRQAPYRQATYALMLGMFKSCKKHLSECSKRFVVLDNKATASGTLTALAQLYFVNQVSVIVGGFRVEAAHTLAKWGDLLEMPMLLLNKEAEVFEKRNFSFQVYPDERLLAHSLAKVIAARGYQKISFLRPDHRKATGISHWLQRYLAHLSVDVTSIVQYVSGNFESMDTAVRNLLNINPAQRKEEFEAAYREAKRLAETRGQKFDPRLVYLRPNVNADAVFIPDDFRMVRHLIKLFRYHGVHHLPLIGNHEWRSQALLTPYDRFLENSFFADFIGSYAQAGEVIGLEYDPGALLIPPQEASAVDFQLIGFRIAEIALKTLALPKPALPSALSNLANPSQKFFGGSKAFIDINRAPWPTFVFAVRNGHLELIGADKPHRPKPDEMPISMSIRPSEPLHNQPAAASVPVAETEEESSAPRQKSSWH